MNIHLLHTNDVHSQIENYMRIGFDLRNHRNELLSQGQTVYTFDIGDVVDRIRPETDATHGLVNAAMLGALRYDGWVFGNNEGLSIPTDDWEPLAHASKTTVFGTNFRMPGGSPFPFFTNWRVYTHQGVRLGVFGLSPQYEKPYENLAVEVLNPMEQASVAVQALRTAKVDAILVLSHLGLREDRELARLVPGIDVILGGHTHHLMESAERVGNTWIYQAGKHAQAYGHTVLQFNPKTRRVVDVVSRYIPLNPKSEMDCAMLHAYREAIPGMARVLERPVILLNTPLETNYTGECSFANLLVDAMKEAVPCQLGLMMSGALTASLLSGQIRYQDVHASCLTPTKPLLMTLRGIDIRSILAKTLLPEFAERMGYGYGFRGSVIGRMAIAGATAEVRNAGDGNRVQLGTVMIGDEPLDDAAFYRVITCEYLWLSGVYSEFGNGTEIEVLPQLVRELLVRHLQCAGSLTRAQHPRWINTTSRAVL